MPTLWDPTYVKTIKERPQLILVHNTGQVLLCSFIDGAVELISTVESDLTKTGKFALMATWGKLVIVGSNALSEIYNIEAITTNPTVESTFGSFSSSLITDKHSEWDFDYDSGQFFIAGGYQKAGEDAEFK